MAIRGADRTSGTVPESKDSPKRAKMLTEEQVNIMMSEGKVYARKMSVKAVKIKEQVKFDAGDGSILVAEPGDYLVQNVMGDKYTWALPGPYFKANFRES